jgi:endonuclease/exonuclease/phosphatase family metal-dependent hydrolase
MKKTNTLKNSRFMPGLLILVHLSCFSLSCNWHVRLINDQNGQTQKSVTSVKVVPGIGTDTTLDFATWNLEWFGHSGRGPENETKQMENVRKVIAGLEMDLWSVQEVTSKRQFNSLLSGLPGYSGFLANDPIVTDGAAYYSDFGNQELKVGLIYNTSVTSPVSAKVILKDKNYEFAGRPPVEVTLSITAQSDTVDLVVILLHAKAGAGKRDWQRRKTAAVALKSYLDTHHPESNVIVIGDFNDDVDESITASKASSYKVFVDDSSNYIFPTKALSLAAKTSTVFYNDMVDHHLVSNELMSWYIHGSAEVFAADDVLTDYSGTTSDHYPVLTRFNLFAEGK